MPHRRAGAGLYGNRRPGRNARNACRNVRCADRTVARCRPPACPKIIAAVNDRCAGARFPARPARLSWKPRAVDRPARRWPLPAQVYLAMSQQKTPLQRQKSTGAFPCLVSGNSWQRFRPVKLHRALIAGEPRSAVLAQRLCIGSFAFAVRD